LKELARKYLSLFAEGCGLLPCAVALDRLDVLVCGLRSPGVALIMIQIAI